MNQGKLEQQISEYAKLSKENPKVDVATLMMSALQEHHDRSVTAKERRIAYFVSIALPPFGLLFALKYYVFSDKDDAQMVAHTCVLLTVVSLAAFWIFGKLLFSASGTSVEQIQQIKPQDIHQILQ